MASTAISDLTSEAGDTEPPPWPDDAAEAAFLSEQKTTAEPVVPAVPPVASDIVAVEAEAANAPLPELQTLVDRIPADAREVLEDLFRARFVSVKRVQTASLK